MVGLCNDGGLNNYELIDNLIHSKYKENSTEILVDFFHIRIQIL